MKTSVLKNISISAFAALTIASCTSYAGSTAKVGSAQPNIAGTSWVLADQLKGESPTLMVEKGKVNGSAGCNNYFGELTLDPTAGNFVATNIGSTRKMCENMSVETNFLQMMNAANKYVVTGTTLELYKDNLLLLKFNKK